MDIVRHYNNLGVALAKTGDVGKALKEYKRAVLFFPKFKENYRIYYNMCLAQVQDKSRDSYTQALEYLNQALSMKPSFDKGKKTKETIEKALGPRK